MDGQVNGSSHAHFIEWFDWMYAGVDHGYAGNGGKDCVDFIPTSQKWIETIGFLALGMLEVYIASRSLTLPAHVPSEYGRDRTSKKFLLALFCLVYGIELGFKFASRQVIWIFNPCHITTMIQIYLLIARPSRTTMAIFRLHMHMLGGATIAILLPVVNTRVLPFETETYYIQHLLILVTPYYLMRLGGVYTTEPLKDFSWALMSCGLLFIYHWTWMQGIGIVTMVNLNNMLCPAVSDPFHGRWYRVCAVTHQTAMIHVHGKVYTWIARKFLPKQCTDTPPEGADSNGHVKIQ